MGLFSRRSKGRSRSTTAMDPAPRSGASRKETVEHLRGFVTSRVGVEAYIEPPTANDPVTVVLIATTGEWTRRKVPDEKTGFAVAQELGIPAYDVLRTGYPARMRKWNSRQRQR
ncbi:oxidoreductase [Bogoriella caseilytica]|nr:oxidoreductase [Bogoriella caseilytica]